MEMSAENGLLMTSTREVYTFGHWSRREVQWVGEL